MGASCKGWGRTKRCRSGRGTGWGTIISHFYIVGHRSQQPKSSCRFSLLCPIALNTPTSKWKPSTINQKSGLYQAPLVTPSKGGMPSLLGVLLCHGFTWVQSSVDSPYEQCQWSRLMAGAASDTERALLWQGLGSPSQQRQITTWYSCYNTIGVRVTELGSFRSQLVYTIG